MYTSQLGSAQVGVSQLGFANTSFTGGQSGTLDVDLSLSIEFSAPQPLGVWTVDPAFECAFDGTPSSRVGVVGRFDAAIPISCEWTGRARGPVIWTVDGPILRCDWIVAGDVIKKDCLAGDARWVGESGGGDGENCVF